MQVLNDRVNDATWGHN